MLKVIGMYNDRFRLYESVIRRHSSPQSSTFGKLFGGIFDKVFSPNQHVYTFRIPTSVYLRTEMFCEDITEESEYDFDVADLINVLIEDFLRGIRRNPDPEYIYRGLVSRDHKKAVIINHHIYEERSVSKCTPTPNLMELSVHLERRQALKLEIFLADLYEVLNEEPVYVEDVIEILLCDFINSYKQGLINNAFDEIIKHFTKS
ncbi:hypothetical protein D5E69_22730 (plasmid) [Rossellomorea marisflavi]|uniref:hypothetical protein n=1 Tax=Rossellomorea marisflavi TaxID=189381 RepID=UPI0013174C1F|nr:hypothetical protein [Rossellomorea marisflavi]QHA38659.1 hypothetical protein D5E69_22730 [Rossellomorea marisflavi]